MISRVPPLAPLIFIWGVIYFIVVFCVEKEPHKPSTTIYSFISTSANEIDGNNVDSVIVHGRVSNLKFNSTAIVKGNFADSTKVDYASFSQCEFLGELKVRSDTNYTGIVFCNCVFDSSVLIDFYTRISQKEKYYITFDSCFFKQGVKLVNNLSNLDIVNGNTLQILFRNTRVMGVLDASGLVLNGKKAVNIFKSTIDTLNLSDLSGDFLIDLNPPNTRALDDGAKTMLNITGTPIDQIKFQYKHYELMFGQNTYIDENELTYNSLIKKYNREGSAESEKLAVTSYRRAKVNGDYFLYVINKYWWCFGYEKCWVMLHTIWLLFLFCCINFCYIDKLHNEVYTIKALDGYNLKKLRSRVWPAFIFTVIVFFSLKIDVEKMKFHRICFVLYFFANYIVGIICIAYLANYVLSR